MTDPELPQPPADKEGPSADILPPEAAEPGSIDVLALLIHHQTHRPDLLIQAIEKHDPGFIKEYNKKAREFQSINQMSRFRFARTQAYAGLAVRICATVAILYLVWVAITHGYADFWSLVGFAVVFGVAQGGSRDFSRLVGAISDRIAGAKRDDDI